MRSRKSLVARVLFLQIVSLTIITIQHGLLLRNLGCSLDWLGLFVLTVTTSIIRIVSISPGNIGLREAASGGVTKSFGFSFEIGILASAVGRVISLFWILLLGSVFAFILLKDSRGTPGNDDSQRRSRERSL